MIYDTSWQNYAKGNLIWLSKKQFDDWASSWNFCYFTVPQKLCSLLSITDFQMENNLKNRLEGNNISLTKNVLCFRPNHQTICSPRFISVKKKKKRCSWLQHYIRTAELKYSFTAGKSMLLLRKLSTKAPTLLLQMILQNQDTPSTVGTLQALILLGTSAPL